MQIQNLVCNLPRQCFVELQIKCLKKLYIIYNTFFRPFLITMSLILQLGIKNKKNYIITRISHVHKPKPGQLQRQ